MPAETFTYTMKHLDRQLWQEFKAAAAKKGLSVRSLIHRLIVDFLKQNAN